jgi:hypothetical protein
MDLREETVEEGRRDPAIELTRLAAKAHQIAESREGPLIEDEATVCSLLGIKAS